MAYITESRRITAFSTAFPVAQNMAISRSPEDGGASKHDEFVHEVEASNVPLKIDLRTGAAKCHSVKSQNIA